MNNLQLITNSPPIDSKSGVPGDWADLPGPVVSVMQPYIFPYLGYFSLLHACDHFVFYDDVQHISRGWINRNRILIHGFPHTFTVPLAQAHQSDRIDTLRTHDFATFRARLLKQLACAYRRAPQFEPTYAWVQQVLEGDPTSMAELAMRSVRLGAERLGVLRRFVRSSEQLATTRGLPRAERLATITRALGGRRYINSPGGRMLYRQTDFAPFGVALRIVQPVLLPYAQVGSHAFVPGLSIIDALMHLPPHQVAEKMKSYTLEHVE